MNGDAKPLSPADEPLIQAALDRLRGSFRCDKEPNKPLTPAELTKLVDKACHDTQTRADLLRRNDDLLKRLMACQTDRINLTKWAKQKARSGK